MSYKPVRKRAYTLAEMAGRESCKDSAGRSWRIRTCTLGEIGRFQNLLAGTVVRPGARSWVRFLQHSLIHPTPGPVVMLRRAVGLPDLSSRFVSRNVSMKDALALRDRIVEANLDMGFDDFLRLCEQITGRSEQTESSSENRSKETAEPG